MLDEALLTRCPNGLLIQTFGVQFAAVQARHLRADQRDAVCEVLCTVLRPEREAVVMGGQRLRMRPSLVRRGRIRRGRSGERGVEVVVGLFKQTARCLEKPSCLHGRRECWRILPGIQARLQLINPIPTANVGRTGLEMLLEASFVESVAPKRAE